MIFVLQDEALASRAETERGQPRDGGVFGVGIAQENGFASRIADEGRFAFAFGEAKGSRAIRILRAKFAAQFAE